MPLKPQLEIMLKFQEICLVGGYFVLFVFVHVHITMEENGQVYLCNNNQFQLQKTLSNGFLSLKTLSKLIIKRLWPKMNIWKGKSQMTLLNLTSPSVGSFIPGLRHWIPTIFILWRIWLAIFWAVSPTPKKLWKVHVVFFFKIPVNWNLLCGASKTNFGPHYTSGPKGGHIFFSFWKNEWEFQLES